MSNKEFDEDFFAYSRQLCNLVDKKRDKNYSCLFSPDDGKYFYLVSVSKYTKHERAMFLEPR